MMTIQVLAGYWDFDLETRELLLCPRSRRMFGLTGSLPKRLASYDWEPRIHPDDMPTIDGELETAERHNDVYAARFRAVRPDGSVCQILGIGRAAAGDPKRFVGLNFDLDQAAAVAEQESRSAGSSMPLARAFMLGSGPANENHLRPWRAWLPPVTTASRVTAERKLLLRMAQAMFERRQLRQRFLNPAMLGEPAFDILLALYGQAASRTLSMEMLSSLIGLSPSRAVRWLRFLVKEGLALTVDGCAGDAGAITVALTDKGRIALDEYFRATGSVS